MNAYSPRSIIALLAFSLGLAGHVSTAGAASGSASGKDKEFVTMAAQGSHAEVETGQLAQKNGQSDAVRKFGARMVQDHGNANKELEKIVKPLGITPPKETDAKHKAVAQKLAKLKGAEFDREYAAQMVKDHEMTIALFEKQAKGGDNPELKQFATKQLPILQEHLKMAKSLPGR